MKFPKMIVPILAIGTISAASFAAPPFSSIEKTPEIKGSVFYSMKETPSEFSLVSGYNNSDLSELTGKQNPNPIKNKAGTCTFSPQIAYLPSAEAGRGDKYLTLSYIYQNAQISPHLPSVVKKSHVSAGKTNLEVLTSSYDVPASKDNSDSKTGYYRTIAVRAMDTTLPIPYVSESDSKGLPTVVLTYDCQSASDYKDGDFSALLSSVNVNLMDTISNAPAVKKEPVNPTPSPTATSSAASTDGPSAEETPSESPSATTTGNSKASPNGATGTKSGPVMSTKPTTSPKA